VILIIYLRKVILSWRNWSSAVFGLEKEQSQKSFNQGITAVVFCLLLAGGVFVVNTFITPSVPGINQLPTPTIDLTAQPPTPTVNITTEATLQGIIPTITSYLSQGCIPGQIEWTDPVNGDTVRGKIELKGTVNIENMGYYKYEYSPMGSDSWTTIAAGNTLVVDGPLGGSWDTSSLTSGEYEIRLIVTDNQNNPLPACTIQINIQPVEQS
jgi:hypothetical protein